MTTYILDEALADHWYVEWLDPAKHTRFHSPRLNQEMERRRQVWMDSNGLRRSSARPSLARVAGKQLFRPERRVYYSFWEERQQYPAALGWFDHTSIFYGDGGHVLTTQPYDLTTEKVAALSALCQEIGCAVEVLPSDGWHYPGRCPLVVVRRRVDGAPLTIRHDPPDRLIVTWSGDDNLDMEVWGEAFR
jgi:hypothetical protein